MNRTTIKKVLRRAAGGAEFINQHQLKTAMGWGNTRTSNLLEGLDYICMKKIRQYDIDEVAERIYEQVRRVS